MSTQIEEEHPDLVSEVQDLARLHVDLARSEVRDGTRRLQAGIALFLMALVSMGLAVLAGTVTLFLLLQSWVSPWVAAALTTVLLVAFMFFGVRLGRWQLKGTRALLLPRTRALLGELFSWHGDKPSSS